MMLSFVELTVSVTKLVAMAPLLMVPFETSAKTWSQSCDVVVVALPSSSNWLLGRSPVPPAAGVPEMSRGITALAVIDSLTPAGWAALMVVWEAVGCLGFGASIVGAAGPLGWCGGGGGAHR